MAIKAIVFDKDGTLLDFDAYWVTVSRLALEDLVQKLNIKDISVDTLLEAFGVHGGITDVRGILCWGTYSGMGEILYGILKDQLGTMSLESFTETMVDAYHRFASAGIMQPTCDGLREMLLSLREQGILLGVVTSDDAYVTEKCLSVLDIEDLFSCLYTDDGKIPAKPDPYAIHDICRRYSLKPEEIVMVGDTLTDMCFAKNGGVRAIGVAKTEENRDVLLGMTDTVVPDVSYVAKMLAEGTL